MHNARRRGPPITATTGSARLAGGSSDPAAPLAREREESYHRRASRPPPSPHPRVQAVVARRQIRVGSGRIHAGAVKLRAAAALAGSGAGGPNESRTGPRLSLPPPPPLQLHGSVWCAEWSRWVECSNAITSTSWAANRGPSPCSSSSSGHRGAAVPCVRADGC